jgi:KaiC/GvpD/RAD55 family RecA-like ATPase
MNIAMLLENMTVEKFGDAFEPKMVTDLVPVGKTLIYGESGSGKTYGMIKHLNRHQIKPVLLDFDHNKRVDNLDFYFVDGAFYLELLRNSGAATTSKSAEDEVRENIRALLEDIFYEVQDNTYNDSVRYMTYEEFERSKYKLLSKSRDDFDVAVTTLNGRDGKDYEDMLENAIGNIDNFDIEVEEIKNNNKNETSYILQNETVIIDTCANALKHFDAFADFETFDNRLLRDGNNVILVAHSSSKGNKQIPDIEQVFANHVDCKLELNRDITKTKGEEVYLIVKKLRGYKGTPTIKNWER